MRRLTLTLVLCLAACTEHGNNQCQFAGANDVVGSIELRNPETGQCQFFDVGPQCTPGCLCPDIGVALPDWAQCSGACEALAEADCLANANCHASFQSDAAGAPTFMACFELPPSGMVTGVCSGVDAQTCSEHTDCVSVYTVGAGTPAFNQCLAEVKPAACSTLTTEAACKARADCDPVFTGTNCTCDHNGCTCATQTFKTCEPL